MFMAALSRADGRIPSPETTSGQYFNSTGWTSAAAYTEISLLSLPAAPAPDGSQNTILYKRT
jgi:hypothetical protein